MIDSVSEERKSILASLVESWKPQQIRDLAASLTRLADSIEQEWSPSNVNSVFRWPNRLAGIERNALNLAMKARSIYDLRSRRRDFVPDGVLGEPAWDMLLELFMQYAGGAKVSTSSLSIASNVPQTTALRYIQILENLDMVKRAASSTDRRVNFVELTDRGILAVGAFLEQHG